MLRRMLNLYRNHKKQKVHFLHIGKTGGTALKSVLKEYPGTSNYIIELHGHETSLSDIPRGEKVIFFLRDPISRFISGFYSRQRKGQPRYYSEWSSKEKVIFDTFNTPNEVACALADRTPASLEAMKGVQHFRKYNYWYKSLDYFQSRIDDIMYVGFQETLNEDFSKLKMIFNIPESTKLPSDDISAHRNPDNLDRSIEKRGELAVREWYQEDIEFLSTCKEIMSYKALQRTSR